MTNRKLKLIIAVAWIISTVVFSLVFSGFNYLLQEEWRISQTLISAVLYGSFNLVTFSILYKMNKDNQIK